MSICIIVPRIVKRAIRTRVSIRAENGMERHVILSACNADPMLSPTALPQVLRKGWKTHSRETPAFPPEHCPGRHSIRPLEIPGLSGYLQTQLKRTRFLTGKNSTADAVGGSALSSPSSGGHHLLLELSPSYLPQYRPQLS